MSGHGRSWLIVASVVAGVLVLGGCSGSGSESADTTSPGATTSSEAASPAPVESASPGEVAYAKHPRSKCKDADDLTANVRLYNYMQRIPLKDFALVSGDEASALWLKQTGSKAFETDGNGEGDWGCAEVPYAVKNGADQTYYYSDARVWGDHPGWWGHQQECEWCDAPKGYVNFTCARHTDTGFPGCPDPALTGDVTARWDATDTSDGDEKLNSHPPCDTSSGVIGCYLLIPDKTSNDYDFAFESYAWTAPMQTTVSTRFTSRDGSFPERPDGTTPVSQKLYVAWEVANASIGSGRWVDNRSPNGQVATVKRSLVIGGYAKAASGTTTMSFRLVPKYFTNARGDALNCTKGTTKTTCTYVKSGDTPDGISEFFAEDPFISVSASLTLENVANTYGPPKVTASPISCKSNFATADSKNLVVKCDPEAEAGKSAYTYGATWLASITTG